MERPVFQPVGTPVEELDTPALVVDLDVMARNIEVVHSFFRQSASQSRANLRPHVASHQCPQIAHLQTVEADIVSGISVTTVGEAEVFSQAGFDDVLVCGQVVTRPKIDRLCALAVVNRITVTVDNPKNVDDLSLAAQARGVSLSLVVEVELGLGGSGVSPGAPALDLAKQISASPGLSFAGLLATPPAALARVSEDVGSLAKDAGSLESEARQQLQPLVDTRELLEKAGLPVSMVSVAGTRIYDIAGGFLGVTEVRAGAYPLMDYPSCLVRNEFQPAAKVMSQVMSHPVKNRAVLDAGHKATGPDLGLAVLEGHAGANATRFSAEHGILELEGPAMDDLQPGDRAWLVPYDLGLCLNQYDYIRAVRHGRLEGFWLMAGRGQFS